MAAGGLAPLARMYQEQLGRRARPVGTVGLLLGLNTLSFETEEYSQLYIEKDVKSTIKNKRVRPKG